MSLKGPYTKDTDLTIASGMNEYTLPPKLYTKMIYGSQELKCPIIEYNRTIAFLLREQSPDQDLQCQHHLGACQIHSFSELKYLLSQILHLN